MKDTLGRENRSLKNKTCLVCKATFRPFRETSKYCSRPCAWSQNGKTQAKAAKNVAWCRPNKRGYITGFVRDSNGRKRHARQHRYIMEQHLGRKLLANEDVHHLDGNRSNNAISNLQVIDHAEHSKIKPPGYVAKKGYKMNLTAAARKARSERMKKMRAKQTQARAALAEARS